MDSALLSFIEGRKTAFLASVDADGFPNLKAMLAPRKIEGGRIFYFTTNTSSLRVEQYRSNPKAALYFYERGRFKYQGLMLKGLVEVLSEPVSKAEIWRSGDERFYKGGVADPDYCVLRFTASEGRYYCGLKTHSFSL